MMSLRFWPVSRFACFRLMDPVPGMVTDDGHSSISAPAFPTDEIEKKDNRVFFMREVMGHRLPPRANPAPHPGDRGVSE